MKLKSERGYLLISTLFFLIFSGLFSQSIIKISGNHIIQLQQISSAYQAKTALNMSKELLKQKTELEEIPEKGSMTTSLGTILIKRRETATEYIFTLTLTTNSEAQYSDQLTITRSEAEEERPEEQNEETEAKEDTKKETHENEIPEETMIDSEVENDKESEEKAEEITMADD